MATSRIKFTYFDGWGRGEISRYIMAAGNIDYQDVRLSWEEWMNLKPRTPFQVMPLLEVDGEVIDQSTAIARYLAKKANLAGDTDWEQAQADQVVGHYFDTISKMFDIYFKRSDGQTYFAQTVTNFLNNIDNLLAKRGGHYLVGAKLTWADIAVVQFLDAVRDFNFPQDLPDLDMRDQIPQKYPALQGLRTRVHQVPGLKKYLANRPPSMIWKNL